MYFDVYKDQDPSKQGALNAIDVLKREAKDADVFDESGER